METVYYPRLHTDGTTTVAKFVDGDFRVSYTITHGTCDCPGCSYHRTQCKHLRLKRYWLSIGLPQRGFIQTASNAWVMVPKREF